MSYSDIEILFKKNSLMYWGHSITFTFYDVLKTIKLAKMVNPKIIVVLGIPPILCSGKKLFPIKVDYIIEGDGEISF